VRGHKSVVLAAALSGVIAGCATQADLADIRREQRGIRTQLADTRATLDSVQRDLATTRGRVQENRHAERADTRMQNLEERLSAIEQARGGAPADSGAGAETAANPAPVATPAPETGRVASVPPPDRDDAAETPDQYRKALSLVRQREYDRAIQQFRECYYTLGDYSQAILQFNEVRQRYAKSDRAAAALLKIGLSFLEMGNKSEAKLAFQKVVNDYPTAPEAGQAREKLRSLGA
jgi:TolA-binding protein